MYKENLIRLSAGFFSRDFTGKSEWHDIFKDLKEKNLQLAILNLASLLFRTEAKIKKFPNKS